jgi:hypothetical protein
VLKSALELISAAVKTHPKLSEKLQSYGTETKKADRVISLIRAEKGLHTSGVATGIRMLHSLGEILVKDLVSLEAGKGMTPSGLLSGCNVTLTVVDGQPRAGTSRGKD